MVGIPGRFVYPLRRVDKPLNFDQLREIIVADYHDRLKACYRQKSFRTGAKTNIHPEIKHKQILVIKEFEVIKKY